MRDSSAPQLLVASPLPETIFLSRPCQQRGMCACAVQPFELQLHTNCESNPPRCGSDPPCSVCCRGSDFG